MNIRHEFENNTRFLLGDGSSGFFTSNWLGFGALKSFIQPDAWKCLEWKNITIREAITQGEKLGAKTEIPSTQSEKLEQAPTHCGLQITGFNHHNVESSCPRRGAPRRRQASLLLPDSGSSLRPVETEFASV